MREIVLGWRWRVRSYKRMASERRARREEEDEYGSSVAGPSTYEVYGSLGDL